MRGMATLPQGNQELLVVRDKVGSPQVSLGQASPWNVIFFSLQCFDTVGWATGRASGLLKTGCWFVGDDLTGALHDL